MDNVDHLRKSALRSRIESILHDALSPVQQLIRLTGEMAIAGLSGMAAEMLASLRPIEEQRLVLASEGDGLAAIDFRAMLLQEMVLRQNIQQHDDAVHDLCAVLSRLGHPLARLPLTLSPLEIPVSFRNYSPKASSWGSDLPGWRETENKVTSKPNGEIASAVTSPDEALLIGAATENWTDGSNGIIESRLFRLDRVFEIENLLSQFASLPLPFDNSELVAAQITPKHAYKLLFEAASWGGAYNHGVHGALGRLASWSSFAALAGCPKDWGFDGAERMVQQCHWIWFDAPAAWYNHVAWDLGVACLREDRQTLALLAATDTD